jgi:hypothetical protein
MSFYVIWREKTLEQLGLGLHIFKMRGELLKCLLILLRSSMMPCILDAYYLSFFLDCMLMIFMCLYVLFYKDFSVVEYNWCQLRFTLFALIVLVVGEHDGL